MPHIVSGPIYHFTSFESAENILRTKELWFSPKSRSKNGDSDAQQIKKRLDHFNRRFQNLREIEDAKELTEWLHVVEQQSYYLASFCEQKNNQHLLEHYSKFEACLEFDTEFFENLRIKRKLISHPVRYLNMTSWKNQAEVYLRELLGKYDFSIRKNYYLFCAEILVFCLFYKDKQYAPEREIRLVYWPEACEACEEIRIEDGMAKLHSPELLIRQYNCACDLA